MWKSRLSLSCSCWRNTRRVVEPVQRGTVKCPSRVSQCRYADSKTVKSEAVLQNSALDCKTATQAYCAGLKQPATRASLKSNQELDGAAPNLTAEVVKRTADAAASIEFLPVATSGTETGAKSVPLQVQHTPVIPQTAPKPPHLPSPDDSRRIASNETTTADDVKDLTRDDRSVSEEPEPRNVDIVHQPTVAETHQCASATATVGGDRVTAEAKELEAHLKAEREGFAANNGAGHCRHETFPTTDQQLEKSAEQGFDQQNESVPVVVKERYDGQTQARHYDADSRTHSRAKSTESPQQDSDDYERKSVHDTQSSQRFVGYDRGKDETSISQDQPHSAQIRGERITADAPQTRTTQRVKRSRKKKKKVSKTKGKRRHGKTGRR